MGQAYLGGGTEVLKEDQILPNVRYAVYKTLTWSHKFNPAGYKKNIKYTVARFEEVMDTFNGKRYFEETSRLVYKNKAEALKVYNATVKGLKGE